jgi:hypothetical protein
LLQSKGQSKLLHKTQIHVLDGGQNKTKVGRSVPVRLGTSYGFGGGFGGVGGFGQPGTVGTGVQGAINQGVAAGLGTLGGFGGLGGFPGVDSIQYRDVGLVIDATPTITNEGYVEIKMNFETSDVVASGAEANLTPVFTQRSLNTVARIQDGVTAVVAGVSQETKGDSRASIPVLGMLPIVGRLFTTPRQESRQSDVIITVTPHIIRSAGITSKDYLAIVGPPQQGGLNQSIEDVVNRALIAEEEERRLIAKDQPGVPLDAPAATQPANFNAPQRVTIGSPTVQPVNNEDRSPRAPNNQQFNPVTSVGNPPPSAPIAPEQPQVEIQGEPEAGGANPQQPGQAPGQPGKEGEQDQGQLTTQPAQAVPQASVVPAQRPEHVERAIARIAAEERAKRAAEATNKSGKPQPQPQVEFPKELLTPGPQQKVAPAAPKMADASRANPNANQAVTFSLSPKPVKQRLGKTFTVTVEASSQAQMSGASIALKYDASKLQVKSVKDGGMFGSQPEFSYDINEKGILIVNVRHPRNMPTASNGRVVMIEFTAIGAGQSEIAFNGNDTKVRVGSAQVLAGGLAAPVTISRDSVTSSNEK